MLVSEASLISLLGKAHDNVFTLGLPSALVFGQEKEPRPSVPRIAMARSRLPLPLGQEAETGDGLLFPA